MALSRWNAYDFVELGCLVSLMSPLCKQGKKRNSLIANNVFSNGVLMAEG
jgi:hypothetical protein